ncbi:hypothetical protein PtB15_4B668 [Puccinia triticina]|nr:hypothetical protein PtB15_4B668 [Puccinia triticina]
MDNSVAQHTPEEPIWKNLSAYIVRLFQPAFQSPNKISTLHKPPTRTELAEAITTDFLKHWQHNQPTSPFLIPHSSSQIADKSKFTFKKGDSSPLTPTPTPSGSGSNIGSTQSYKGKEKAIASQSNNENDNFPDQEDDEDNEEAFPPQKRKGPGCPRKNILADASKRMKRN